MTDEGHQYVMKFFQMCEREAEILEQTRHDDPTRARDEEGAGWA